MPCNQLESLAESLFQAFYNRELLGPKKPLFSELSIDEAYNVQQLIAQKRVAIGEKIAGFKVGCTSRAIRSQFGLSEPISARLFEPHIVNDQARLDWRNYTNCAIEPELVLKLGKDLQGHNLSDNDLIHAIDYVSPGIEIHNFKFWQSPPTLQELICSGGIHAGLVVGNTRISPNQLGFKEELFSVYENGTLTTSAPASEILGGPLHSLRWLVNAQTAKGDCLKKNSMVIPGSPVELVNINHDTELRIAIKGVGELTTFFERLPSTKNPN